MPTGYTSKIYDDKDQSPRDFILTCARAFGATITQRDDDLNEPPKLREHDNHDAEMAAKYSAELAEVRAWTTDELSAAAAADNGKALTAWRESKLKSDALRVRYLAMLSEVDRWTAPTDDHMGLKEFMVNQLRESIQFDCDSRPAPTGVTGYEYRAQRIEFLTRMAASYEKYAREEIERVDGANAWITALYDSLKSVSA